MSQRSFMAESAWLWLHEALDSAHYGILIETGGRVAYANKTYAEMLGYRRSTDLVHRPVCELIADADVDRLLRFGRMRSAGQRVPSTYEFAARLRDGSTVNLQASVSLSRFGPTSYITTIVRPVPAAIDTGGPLAGPHDELSARERQIFEMLLAGKRPKAIAFDLRLTENTVATHRTRLLMKLGVTDTRELFRYALRHHLIDWS
ncbi:MAG TPA: LuxR C-terminal-related transcriptional regulator [Thermoanaerobaculia bacterium]|nr:LuxR C-terminal-related transcriptional regulator [Thermoanaerobaculia bacterium]